LHGSAGRSLHNLPACRSSHVSLFDAVPYHTILYLPSKATVLRELSHPNIVRMYDFYEDEPDYFFVVLELMDGGELLQRIKEKVKRGVTVFSMIFLRYFFFWSESIGEFLSIGEKFARLDTKKTHLSSFL